MTLAGGVQARTVKHTTAYGITVPADKIHGIDVSRYQERIDWKDLATMKSGKDSIGITFVFIKATEGQSLKDPYFQHNWSETKKYAIIRGAYHYYKPNVNSSLQVKNFTNMVKLQKGDLPPVLDIEEVGKYGAANMQKGIKRWLTQIEKHYGVKPIIYTNIDFYRKYLSGKEFEGYPVWIAHYTKRIPSVERDWVFWQHSDKGTVSNIRSKVAFNVLNGSMDDLLALCKQ